MVLGNTFVNLNFQAKITELKRFIGRSPKMCSTPKSINGCWILQQHSKSFGRSIGYRVGNQLILYLMWAGLCLLILLLISCFSSPRSGKYVYQPMTNVCQLPSTAVPPAGAEYSNTIDLSLSLAERFLKLAPCFQSPPPLESPKYCVIADLFTDDYIVKRINGKMCYVQRPPPPLPEPPHAASPAPPAALSTPQMPPTPAQPRQPVKPAPLTQHGPAPPPVQPAQQVHSEQKPSPVDKIKGPKMDHCSSPSSSEDSGINALGLHYLESCEDESEEEEDDELSTDGNSSPGSLWDQDDCSLLSPSKSMIEIIEKIETTV